MSIIEEIQARHDKHSLEPGPRDLSIAQIYAHADRALLLGLVWGGLANGCYYGADDSACAVKGAPGEWYPCWPCWLRYKLEESRCHSRNLDLPVKLRAIAEGLDINAEGETFAGESPERIAQFREEARVVRDAARWIENQLPPPAVVESPEDRGQPAKGSR